MLCFSPLSIEQIFKSSLTVLNGFYRNRNKEVIGREELVIDNSSFILLRSSGYFQ